MVRRIHSFFPNSFPLPLSTSYTLICYFLCTFDSPSPSLGRKMEFWGPGRVTDGARPFHPRAVRKPHSFFPISLPLSLSTSYTLICYLFCTFDSPSPSLGRKMEFWGPGRVTDGAWPFHPRMVRKPHSFSPNPFPIYMSTSYTLTCYLFCTFDSPSPSLGRKMEFWGPG